MTGGGGGGGGVGGGIGRSPPPPLSSPVRVNTRTNTTASTTMRLSPPQTKIFLRFDQRFVPGLIESSSGIELYSYSSSYQQFPLFLDISSRLEGKMDVIKIFYLLKILLIE